MGFWEWALYCAHKVKAMKNGRKLYEGYKDIGYCIGNINHGYNNEERGEAVKIARGEGDFPIASQIE